MPLTDLAIRRAQPKDTAWKLFDEKGLHLIISPTGSKRWHLKYHFENKERRIALGPYPEVSLKAARRKRDEARALVEDGKDPSRERKAALQEAKLAARNTFETVARDYINYRVADGIAEVTRSKAEWLLSVLAPSIGSRPIAEITAPELLYVLNEIQSDGRRETAHRLRSFAGRVFNHAILTGRALHNPSVALRGQLFTRQVRHHPAIVDSAMLGQLLREIDRYSGRPTTVGILKVTPHLFQRPGEIRQMKWSDLDFGRQRWTIPSEVMKMRRSHTVPLSRQVIAILGEMKDLSYSSEFVFSAYHKPRQPISENAVNQALRRMGYAEIMTAHGFRSTASSMLNESNLWNSDAIERALAHQDSNQVRATYNRSDYWEERERMMQWWSDYLDELKAKPELSR